MSQNWIYKLLCDHYWMSMLLIQLWILHFPAGYEYRTLNNALSYSWTNRSSTTGTVST
ncbi:MAG: hypothetical protein KA408_15955 [Flavobacteriales bacterium]|nr:hypothetical protein [Flavobacteriales bacterium]